MRVDLGRLRSCLYMRRTSVAALLTNRSTSSSARIATRHSLKKCPDPVSAQPQRGVLTLAIVRASNAAQLLVHLDRQAGRAAIAQRTRRRAMAGRSSDEGLSSTRTQEAWERRINEAIRNQMHRA